MQQPIQLIFFRHGIAADRETFIGPDASRPLTEEGVIKTTAIARKFVPLYPPDIIVTSELLRAQETAAVVARVAGEISRARDLPIKKSSSLNPEGSWQEWTNFLAHNVIPKLHAKDPEEFCNIYLTGHEPSISAFFARYIRASEECVGFKKAGIGIIRLEASDKGRILALLTPKLILGL